MIFLSLLMLPVGRVGPNDGGGLLAPFCADSALIFRTSPAVDFFSVYDAGSRLLEGRDPYGVNAAGGKGLHAPYVATFRYLPVTVLWLSVPLNLLPPWPAFYAWVVLCFLLQVANFLLCLGRAPDRALLLGLLWFCWFPLIAEWHMGQFTFFMATLLLWGFDAMLSGTRLGAVGWLFATLLKVYPIGMAPSLWLWGHRRTVLVALALVFGATFLFRAYAPEGLQEGLVERGVSGRLIGEARLPYAGAMGVQEVVNALTWKASGLSFTPHREQAVSDWVRRLVPLMNGVLLAVYLAGAAWVLWHSRRRASWYAVGYYWLAWFFAYVDCWEHHYVLVQALAAGLLAWGLLSPRLTFVVWLSAGAPSLWWLWYRTGYADALLPETLGTIYFIQRPVSIFLLAAACLRGLWKSEKSSFLECY
jgi:hypothetical protein